MKVDTSHHDALNRSPYGPNLRCDRLDIRDPKFVTETDNAANLVAQFRRASDELVSAFAGEIGESTRSEN